MSLPDPLLTLYTTEDEDVYSITTYRNPGETDEQFVDRHCRDVFAMVDSITNDPAWKLEADWVTVKVEIQENETKAQFVARYHDELK